MRPLSFRRAAAISLAVLTGGFLASGATRTPSEIATEIKSLKEAIAMQEAEVARIKKQRDAALNGVVGLGPKYPGAPSGWDDFSISADLNNHAGSALAHYQKELDIAEAGLREGKSQLSALRQEMSESRQTGVGEGLPTAAPPVTRAPPVATLPPRSTTSPSTTATAKPMAEQPPAAKPTATTTAAPSAKPKSKDLDCLCKCACAALGMNVNNVKTYYSTSPVKHVNPNGEVSESCMSPSNGPCVCQGFVCRRAPMVSSGTCADGCGG